MVLFPTGGLKPVEFEKMVASIPRYEGLDRLIRKYYVLTEDEKKVEVFIFGIVGKRRSSFNEEWKIRIRELFGETPMLEYLDCSIV